MKFFSPDPADRSIYGHKFKWTAEHLSSKALHPLIFTYDVVSTEALDRLEELAISNASHSEDEIRKKAAETVSVSLPERTGPENSDQSQTHKLRDMYTQVLTYKDRDAKIAQLWTEVNTVPDWVDWEEIERGQKVFWRYGGAAFTALTFLSLLGGMGSGRTVETLDRTGGFAVPVVRRRLLETTQHLLAVHRDLESIKPGGDGWMASVRVRLLHTVIRQRILKIARDDSKYYDVKRFGVPVNDLDCVGTINTFSSALIWLGLPRQGIHLSPPEITAYLHLWRYISYIMGVPHDWLRYPSTAKAMMESLFMSEIRPTPSSATLANNIITGLEGTPPMWASRGFLCVQARWLNGAKLADELEIGNKRIYKEKNVSTNVTGMWSWVWQRDLWWEWWFTLLVATQCAVFILGAWTSRMSRRLDKRRIRRTRTVLHNLIINNKSWGALGYTATFMLKWAPDPARLTTTRGLPAPDRALCSGAWNQAGIERMLVWFLICFVIVLLGAGWGAWWIVLGFLGKCGGLGMLWEGMLANANS